MNEPKAKSKDNTVDVKKLSLLEKIRLCERWEDSGLKGIRKKRVKRLLGKTPFLWKLFNKMANASLFVLFRFALTSISSSLSSENSEFAAVFKLF